MNSQKIYDEIMNIPEIVSYITSEPFRYKIVPFVDYWGMKMNTCVLAERNLDPTFMKYRHDVMHVSVLRSEHMPSYKIEMIYPKFFINENESIDMDSRFFYNENYLFTYTIMDDKIKFF